jgi:hypothetical protein
MDAFRTAEGHLVSYRRGGGRRNRPRLVARSGPATPSPSAPGCGHAPAPAKRG